MLNIEKTRVISYGAKQSVTVYQDNDDTNKWYVVPKPTIPLDEKGVPQFSLVRYEDAEGVHGNCSFEVELQVSDEALAAVKKELGAGVTIGQLDWKTAKTWFTYVVGSKTSQLVAEPSMYGNLRASFVVHLADEATVNAFTNAFGPGGSAGGTFRVQYDLTAFARLPPVTVTVDFDASTAFKYNRDVHVSRDTWGHVTSRTATIHEQLNESQAGTVTVDPGGRPLDQATKQQLLSWGHQTLEADVEKAVDDVMKIIGENNSDHFTVNQVASFHDTYVEGQVVPWILSPIENLPAFEAGTWKEVYSQVDNRQLDVAFTVRDLGKENVESVELVVEYPTKKTANTHTFLPGEPGTWRYHAPGHLDAGTYDPSFEYQYTVRYNDDHQPFQSAKIQTSQTQVQFDARDFAVLEVTFDATTVDFAANANLAMNLAAADGGEAVNLKHIDVEFYFCSASNGVVKHQQFRLKPKNTKQTVSSNTKLPSTNPYQYRLTYVLSDNETIQTGWREDNAGSVYLEQPYKPVAVTLFPLPKLDDYQLIEVMATYKDPANGINENHTWAVQPSQKDASVDQWTFLAPSSSDAYYGYSGEFMKKATDGDDGGVHQLKASRVLLPIITVGDGRAHFSVKIDPSLVKWEDKKIAMITVDMTVDGEQVPSNGPTFQFSPKNAEAQYFGFSYPDADNLAKEAKKSTPPNYSWKATYHFSDGTKKKVSKSNDAEAILVLPEAGS